MNILVLNGSPKKHSDTMHLTNAFISDIIENSSHNVEIINIFERNIKPCTGCFACWQIQNGKCVQQDDQNYILERIIESDVILWSFPLYCYSFPSHVKSVIDRMIPLYKMSMKQTADRVIHDSLVDMSDKHHVVITGCGFPNWTGNFDSLKALCSTLFGDKLTMVCVPETPMLNVPDAKPLTAPLLDKFKLAGKKYADTLTLSDETIQALETPMLPNEVYIQIVNSQQ